MNRGSWLAFGAVDQRRAGGFAAAMLCGVLLAAPSVRAVLFWSTADPNYNTSAPTGDLAESGWQWQGAWGNFLGTPVAPHYFISARHVGGNIGDRFVLDGAPYTTVARFDDPSSDLSIWQVDGTFNLYPDLYSKTNEPGLALVVFGRGTQRGDPVTVQTAAGPQLKGWQWGPADGRQRWGQNQVDQIVNGDDPTQFESGANGKVGQLLRVTFDQDGGPNEAHLSVGDSGGGVFIRDGSSWKLAGINFAVEGPYSLTNSGPGFEAAIFDQRGLYLEEKDQWTVVKDDPAAQPGAFYATRISSHVAWIQSIIAPPAEGIPRLQWAPAPEGPYVDEALARVDSAAHTVTVALPSTDHFYRINANTALFFTTVRVTGTNLVFGYYQDWERRRN